MHISSSHSRHTDSTSLSSIIVDDYGTNANVHVSGSRGRTRERRSDSDSDSPSSPLASASVAVSAFSSASKYKSNSRSKSRKSRSRHARPSLDSQAGYRPPSPARPSLEDSLPNGHTNTNTRSRPISFITPVHGDAKLWYRPTLFNRLLLLLSQLVSFFISSTFLVVIVLWALLADLSRRLPKFLRPVKAASFPWDDKRYLKEKCTKDVRYYASQAGDGYDIVDEEVETEDGFYLRVHRVVNPRHKPQVNGKGGYPVLILHGLFQSSGAFITSEERSLAFWLSEHGGYQVFLGNTRGVFNMGHRSLSRSDPRFWDWTIRELAMYDFPALVEYVCDATGYEKIAFIGHSQGNGIALLSLSEGMRPEIGTKLSCLIALAPVVYAGPLTHGFPFNVLSRIGWRWWRMLFGVLDFIPLMRYAYDWVPAKFFAMVGYAMFAYLFSWTDANWLKRRKVKIFRFTPTPVSSASIFWFCGKGGFAERKCTMDDSLPRWFDASRFPPLALYFGSKDFLVVADSFLGRLRTRERGVRVVRVWWVEECEHCDFYLAAEAVEWCFHLFLEDIEKTRTDGNPYDEESRLPVPSSSENLANVSSEDEIAVVPDDTRLTYDEVGEVDKKLKDGDVRVEVQVQAPPEAEEVLVDV